MNQNIQNIADKVSSYIESKAVPNPNPARVSATQHAEILSDVLTVLDDIATNTGTTPTPSGVTWHEAPTLTIAGSTVTVSAGIANVNGTLKNVPAKSFTPTLPAAGFKQPYSAFSDYLSTPAVHEIDGATVVAETASYAWPTVPENRLWVANFMLTNAGITQTPSGAVKSVTFNGGAKLFPDATGHLAATIPAGSSIPSQTGNANKFLKTDGTTLSWSAVDALPSQTGNSGKFLTTNGTTASWTTLSLAPVQTTGTVVDFTEPRGKAYGTEATPESGNDITSVMTGAIMNVGSIMYHNSGTQPTFNGLAIGNQTGVFYKMSGSGNYKLGVNNWIIFIPVAANKVLYSINN